MRQRVVGEHRTTEQPTTRSLSSTSASPWCPAATPVKRYAHAVADACARPSRSAGLTLTNVCSRGLLATRRFSSAKQASLRDWMRASASLAGSPLCLPHAAPAVKPRCGCPAFDPDEQPHGHRGNPEAAEGCRREPAPIRAFGQGQDDRDQDYGTGGQRVLEGERASAQDAWVDRGDRQVGARRDAPAARDTSEKRTASSRSPRGRAWHTSTCWPCA